MESEFDFCARRAAEEFIAANRAETSEQRKQHRLLAEQYADLVRATLLQRHHKDADAGSAPEGEPSNEPGSACAA